MTQRMPRLRTALQSEYDTLGPGGYPRDFFFEHCVVVKNPQLKIELAFYNRDPETHPGEVPMYLREFLVSIKDGVRLPHGTTMPEHAAEKERDTAETWTVGIAGTRGVEYVRLKITEA